MPYTNYSQVEQRGPASAGFQGSNIYSLAAGMYPILADDTHVGGLSSSTFSRQSMSAAPTIYNVLDDNEIGSAHRKPYLQGNYIMQTEATGDVATIRSAQEEDQLLPEAESRFPPWVRSLLMQAQSVITGQQTNLVATRFTGEGQIQTGGRSAEEMTQSIQGGYEFVESGQTGLGEGSANQPDLYNPITRQYVNVTQQRLDSVGHGVYGQGGRNMRSDIAEIRRDMINGLATMEQGYDAITQRGLEYFRMRAGQTWNPFIADAREGLEIIGEDTGTERERMGKMRELILRGSVGPAGAVAGQYVASTAVTNYANEGARQMTGQHLGNRGAMFSGGMLETYPIGPYTFAKFGPFIMRDSGPRMYEYYVSRIGGEWIQNFQVSSPSETVTNQNVTAASDARLRHAVWVTKSHDSGARRAAIGAITTGAVFGYTSQARRLRPHVDLINANEQMSNKINEVVQWMSSLGTMPQSIVNLLESHRNSFSVNNSDTMNNRNIWAAPYIAIFGQQYAVGTPL